MPGFLKTILFLAVAALLGYFVFCVPLGDRTLYRHLVGISETDEAQALKDGLAKKASDLESEVISKLPAAAPAQPSPAPREQGAPLSRETPADKRALKELIQRTEKSPGRR